MEPPRMPYNLRPRDRKVDYSDSRNGRPKRVTREESIREEEEQEEQYVRFLRKYFLEKHYPYPLMAMKHYNENRREEEQFEVTELVRDICFMYGNVGAFRAMHFKARPKRVGEILPNSSQEVPDVDFFALQHIMPNDDTHVCYCILNPDSNPPDNNAPLSQYIPLRCDACGIPENKGKSSGPKCSPDE